MNKLFNPLKEFAKKVKRQSLMLSKGNVDTRRSTICDSTVLEDNTQDNSSHKSPKFVCCKCKEEKENEKFIICHCQHVFHSSCGVYSCEGVELNINDIIKRTKCPNCGINVDISDMMLMYSDICMRSNTEILKNDYRIQELEKQIGYIQKEFSLCQNSINRVTQHREISKRIMATIVSMIS